MNLLLDTNVVIDYLGRQEPFYKDAERIIAAAYFGDARLWVAVQSFKDAYYVLEHYVESSRVQDAILKLLEVVNPVDLTGEDVVNAARLKWDDLEDCLIATCAVKAGADYLVTRDAKGFARSMVPAISPSEWASLVCAEEGVVYDSVKL